MTGKVLHRVDEHRLVAIRLAHQGARVVGDDELRNATIERQRPFYTNADIIPVDKDLLDNLRHLY